MSRLAIISAALLIALAGSSSPSVIFDQKILPSVKGAVQIEYYDVTGSTVSEIRDSLRTNGHVDGRGMRRYAYTDWFIYWKWPTRQDGTIDLSRAESHYTVRISMPRWNKPVYASPEVEESWREFSDALLLHEQGHADFAHNNAWVVGEAIRQAAHRNPALTAAEADQIGHEEVRKINEMDKRYDEVTRHGATQGAVLVE